MVTFYRPQTKFGARLYLSIGWNSIRLGGPAYGIVTKTVHKTLPRGGGGPGGGWVWEYRGVMGGGAGGLFDMKLTPHV